MKRNFYTKLFLSSVCLGAFSNVAHGFEPTQFTVEPLFWKLRASSSENWAQIISPAGTIRSTEVLKAPFHFDKGIRVGIASQSNSKQWDLTGQLLYFRTTALSHPTVTSGGIYSSYLGNFFANNTEGSHWGPNYREAYLWWKIGIQTGNIEIGRPFYSKNLKLRPYLGLTVAHIHHRINTLWQNPNPTTFFGFNIPQNFSTAFEKLNNRFLGIGPSLGFNTEWSIHQSKDSQFNLLGHFGGALLFGHWKFKESYNNNHGTNIDIQVKPITGAASMIKGLIGVEWKHITPAKHISLWLGYESQIWFDQIQYYSYNMGRLNSLVSLQGLTCGIGVQF